MALGYILIGVMCGVALCCCSGCSVVRRYIVAGRVWSPSSVTQGWWRHLLEHCTGITWMN